MIAATTVADRSAASAFTVASLFSELARDPRLHVYLYVFKSSRRCSCLRSPLQFFSSTFTSSILHVYVERNVKRNYENVGNVVTIKSELT